MGEITEYLPPDILDITLDEHAALVDLLHRLDTGQVHGICMTAWNSCLAHEAGLLRESTVLIAFLDPSRRPVALAAVAVEPLN
jgi:hypothetical protein